MPFVPITWQQLLPFTPSDLQVLLPRILVALAVLILFVLVGRWLGRLANRLVRFSRGGATVGRFMQRGITVLVALAGILAALPILGLNRLTAALLASGGIGALVVGFAFRDLGENMIAGVMLAVNRPFEIHDLVASGEFEGRVRSLNLRSTHVRTADGRDVFLPNADIIKQPLVNYTRDGLRRYSYTVGVDYDDDAREARTLLHRTLEGVEGVLEEPAPTVIIQELSPDTVDLLCHYWVNAFARDRPLDDIRSEVIQRTKDRLLEEGFSLPGRIVEIRTFQPTGRLDVRMSKGEDGAPDRTPPGSGGRS